MTPIVTLSLSLLTVVGLVSIAAIASVAAASILAGGRGPGRGALRRLEAGAASDGLRLAWLVAIVAMAGSLYFSEVAHFEPCRLCWYQRIAMYPLVAILGVGALRNDIAVVRYALPLAAIGAPISAYHYLVEWFPTLAGSACDPRNPCSLVWFREFGFVTLPFMALTGFVLIATLLLLTRRGRASSTGEAPESARDQAGVAVGGPAHRGAR